jgi:hypothetical protein
MQFFKLSRLKEYHVYGLNFPSNEPSPMLAPHDVGA